MDRPYDNSAEHAVTNVEYRTLGVAALHSTACHAVEQQYPLGVQISQCEDLCWWCCTTRYNAAVCTSYWLYSVTGNGQYCSSRNEVFPVEFYMRLLL